MGVVEVLLYVIRLTTLLLCQSRCQSFCQSQCQSHIFHSLFIISAYTLYGNYSRLMTSSFFYSSDDNIWHHYCVLLHHDHAIAHHSFIICANGLFIDSLWSLCALYGTLYVYKDKQSFTYKYRVLCIPWNNKFSHTPKRCRALYSSRLVIQVSEAF